MTTYIQLTIKNDLSVLTYQSDDITLPIGLTNINGYRLQHSPITPYEAEMAIEHIEDTIIPARKLFPTGKISLSCTNEELKQIPIDTIDLKQFISTSQIERAFNELVNVINGGPSNSTTLPLDKSFSAFLLIIREITHHWGLEGITITK
ncbi:hypothetical protein [Providencia sp.]|uniref:hypothetical protein n=1 Tax=Providencia sp. TaxID=589 RepID=UPI000E8F8082|nr:hypothetical protein [Providencia sp.]MBP6079822.1 hypothetical protein [Providencia sp.]HBO23620.1 hypothetical protein [Providencia sp.]